ncbi:DUF3302 domain-containing protein [Roseibium alexandrii]|uniref:Inner membrane protein YiaW n=2 Tax=Roseibium alexandrii TaxID=388408 RepID=A0A0M7AJ35_9HYPH|nr:DUF3302 domain-containing protein [Roseibium alexandrii]EEE43270.2 Protein of unknown function (DUF3302) [Roseibium alexandrii DFL-11]CTQ74889.1 Inner membrane protein YiaW [Roseibium alexandrii]
MNLIDFKLDGYDYLTFLIGVLAVIAFFYVMITLGGLPGKLAEKRKHPHAESVKLGGWIGLFTVFPWIHALMWSYHDSLTIDIRKLPKGGQIKTNADAEDGGGDILSATPALSGASDETEAQVGKQPEEQPKPGGAA